MFSNEEIEIKKRVESEILNRFDGNIEFDEKLDDSEPYYYIFAIGLSDFIKTESELNLQLTYSINAVVDGIILKLNAIDDNIIVRIIVECDDNVICIKCMARPV